MLPRNCRRHWLKELASENILSIKFTLDTFQLLSVWPGLRHSYDAVLREAVPFAECEKTRASDDIAECFTDRGRRAVIFYREARE